MSTIATAGKLYLTPPEIAERYGISLEKVLNWIRSGDLRALNVATRLGGERPRWKVSIADLLAFQERRVAVPPAAPAQRQKRTAEVGNYF